MLPNQSCPICQSPNAERVAKGASTHVVCPVCETFVITRDAEINLNSSRNEVDRNVLSAIVRHHSERGEPLRITSKNLERLVGSAPAPQSPLAALDSLLIYIGDRQSNLDDFVWFDNEKPPITVTRGFKDYRYLKRVLVKRGLVDSDTETHEFLRLSIDGWARYDELRSAQPDSHQAFVAMWFNESVDEAWIKGIRPGLEDAEYTAVRLDAVEHNEKIDDRIIAEIRRSGLVVADLTGERANVYFEAGFAMGLGIPVIWTCRNDWREKIHFDTRQYNYIGWETPAELRERLRLRIEATLPRKG